MAVRALLIFICLGALVVPATDGVQAQEPEGGSDGAKPVSEAAESKKDEDKKGKARKDGKEEEPRREGHTESITVTATRVETDLMKTPVAVTVIDQETMDREGVQNVTDLAQMVPNMDIATKNGQSTPIISLRGVRSTNETELGDPAVGVHLDGIYSPRMQGMLGLMFDNERVEVLRGPQGTLFGRNSTVGSINIISAKPKFTGFESKLNVQYGNFNAPELQLMVNKPVSDTWAFRFAGRYHERDSFITGYWDPNQYDQRFIADKVAGAPEIAPGSFDECNSPECFARTQNSNWWADDLGASIFGLVRADNDDFYMNAKEWAYRVSGLWQPKRDDMSLFVSMQHFQTDSAGGVDLVNCEKLRGRPVYELTEDNQLALDDAGNPIVTGTNDCSNLFPEDDTYQAVVNIPGRLFLDIMYLRTRFDWDINEKLHLVALAGAEDQDRESAQDMELSLNAWDQALFFMPGTGSQSYSGEVQLQSYGNEKFDFIAGVNYFHEKTSTIGFFDNAIDEKALFIQPDRSTTAGAAFAQGTFKLSPRHNMTLGYRFSDETKQDIGGRSYICNVTNECAANDIAASAVNGGQMGFDRETLNTLPIDFFANPLIYPDFNQNDNRGSWSNHDWRIGIDYDADADTLFYAYLATGFKAGGIGDVFEGTIVDGDIDANGNPFVVSAEETTLRTSYDPEVVTTLELGFKQRFLNNNLNLRGAYFFSDYENMQYASVGSLAYTEKWAPILDLNGLPVDADEDGRPDFGWVGTPLVVAYFTQNVPGAEIQGIELEYDATPWRGGRIRGYATWLDTEITEDWITKWDYDPISYFGIDFNSSVDATNDRLRVNLRGNDLAVSPNYKLHMTVDHAFFFEQKNVTIVPWVTAHWEDDSYLTIWNVDRHTDDLDFVILDQDIRYTDDRRAAWSMFHAGVAMYTGAWRAELYAYNITDEVVQWWGGAAEQVPRGSFSMPRTYGLRFGYEF